MFALDQKELGLAFSDYHQSEEGLLLWLAEYFGSCGWLTQGFQRAVAVEEWKLNPCLAFTLKVKDTIGAGDAFFALASLSAVADAPIEVSTFMGNIAGALAANIVGNKESVEKVNVLEYASTLLKM